MIFLLLSNARISCRNYGSAIRRIAPDAAIFFGYLVIPQAMGIEVEMKPNFGPYFTQSYSYDSRCRKVIVPDVHET
jgi:uroporphyrinogen decarboxylase